jgi:hypothetical protein
MSKYYSSSIAFGANQTKTERVVVSPTKIGDVTTDAVSGALTVDEVPTLDSLNPVSSDGVARAVAEALGTETTLVAGSGISLTESSGSLTIAATNVPAVTSNDNGKVLTASYDSGTATGSVSWSAPSGGTPTFTKQMASIESGMFIAQRDTALEPGMYLVSVTINPSEWRQSYYLMLGVTMSDRYPRMSGEFFRCPFDSNLQSNRTYSVVTTINVTSSEAYGFALQYASGNTGPVTPANNDTVDISYVKIADIPA